MSDGYLELSYLQVRAAALLILVNATISLTASGYLRSGTRRSLPDIIGTATTQILTPI